MEAGHLWQRDKVRRSGPQAIVCLICILYDDMYFYLFLTKTYMLFQFKQLEVIRSWHVYPSSLKVNINIKLGSLQTEKYVSL